jgi:hypothetical protein
MEERPKQYDLLHAGLLVIYFSEGCKHLGTIFFEGMEHLFTLPTSSIPLPFAKYTCLQIFECVLRIKLTSLIHFRKPFLYSFL